MKRQIFILAVLALFSINCCAMKDDDQTNSNTISAEDDSYSALSDSFSDQEDSNQDQRTFFFHLSSPRFASFYFSMAGAYKENVRDWVRIRKAWKQIPKPPSHARQDFGSAPFVMHKWCAILTKAIKQLDAKQDIFIIEDTLRYGLIIKLTTPDDHSTKEVFNMCRECDPLNTVLNDECKLDAHIQAHVAQIKDIEEYARNLRTTTESREFQERCLINF